MRRARMVLLLAVPALAMLALRAVRPGGSAAAEGIGAPARVHAFAPRPA